MKLASPERGFRKFREDLQRQRAMNKRCNLPPISPTDTPAYLQPYQKPAYVQAPTPVSQASQAPNVTYNIYPPQPMNMNQKLEFSSLKAMFLLAATGAVVYYLVDPVGFHSTLTMVMEKISLLIGSL